MEFQNQPFRDLKERVDLLEKTVAKLERRSELLNTWGPVRITEEEPTAVREKQDDAGGQPFFKAVGAVQETNEQGS